MRAMTRDERVPARNVPAREVSAREVPARALEHIPHAPSSQLVEIWQHAQTAWPHVTLSAETFFAHLASHLPELRGQHVDQRDRSRDAARDGRCDGSHDGRDGSHDGRDGSHDGPDGSRDGRDGSRDGPCDGSRDGAPVTESLARINTSDLYLACACAMGDRHAVAAFDEHCLGSLDRVLGRLGFGPDVIAEVKQRIRCHVLVADGGRPRIAEFSGRGALRTWVRVMGVREAFRVARRSRRETAVDDTERLQALLTRDHPGLDGMQAGYRRMFAQAFDRALRKLPARDRTMLRQHVLDGLTIDQLGALYRVHRATAARMLTRARRAVLTETRAYMRAELDVSSGELSSILRSIRSHLEITLRGLRRGRG